MTWRNRPVPNFQTAASIPAIIDWLRAVHSSNWTWSRNSRCKYVTIKIDTRHGAYRIEDRDGKELLLEELLHQFGVSPPPIQSVDQNQGEGL